MFNPVEVIRKKRDGIPLEEEELRSFVEGITTGKVPDYQAAAFAMAVYFKGMEAKELFSFCKAMVQTGETLTPAADMTRYVDKHSTGGVGDKLSLILAPLVAACGLRIPKMSGRGLGFSGGTIDKLESIPGFRVSLSAEEFSRQIREIGLGLIGQSEGIAGADKKLYAIRDVTATVESIPLIASSIVSKKIASGSRNIVFDVKVGNGAFMKDLESGEALGRTMVDLVRNFGGRSIAVITNMDCPLGRYVGNSLEIIEVAETLKGRGPSDILELVEVLGAKLLEIGGVTDSEEQGRLMIREKIGNGEGLEKFVQMIRWQGGDPAVLEDYSLLPASRHTLDIRSRATGVVAAIEAETIGRLSVLLGAGRLKKEDGIDYGAGLFIARKPGEEVEAGDLLCSLHYDREDLDLLSLEDLARGAFSISGEAPEAKPLVLKVIGGKN